MCVLLHNSPRSMAIRIVHSTKDGKIAAYVCKWIVHRYWDWMCVYVGRNADYIIQGRLDELDELMDPLQSLVKRLVF